MTENGLVTIASGYDAATTVDRLLSILEHKRVTVFGRFDHAALAAEADVPLRPVTVVLFGNPAACAPLMRISQDLGRREGHGALQLQRPSLDRVAPSCG
jgi:uncharacterized protein (DUF302 family)